LVLDLSLLYVNKINLKSLISIKDNHEITKNKDIAQYIDKWIYENKQKKFK